MELRLNTENIRGFIIWPFVSCFLLWGSASAQMDSIDKQAREHYQPDSWRKSTEPPMLGLKFDDFRISGFDLKEKRHHTPTGGTDYWWRNKRENLNLHIIMNVYPSVEEAHEALYNWLLIGVNVPMQKGSFSGSSNIIGDISWADQGSFTLAFIRDNAVVIMHGMTRVSRHRQLIENIASTIDEAIRTEPRTPDAAENIKRVSPIIDSLVLDQTTLRVNERTRVLVAARDPRGGKLEFSFHATGGNILTTEEGFFYQATTPGKHTITASAVNPYNLRSKKSVTVTVVE